MKIGGLAKIHTGGYSDLDGTFCVILRVADIGSFCDSLYQVMTPDGEFRWYKINNLRIIS
jgi:hypothetical protein